MSTLQQAAQDKWPVVVKAYLLRRPVTPAACVCLVSFAAFWAAQKAADVSMIDLLVYRAEGWAVRNGYDLYAMRATEAELPTTYPPFAALLFIPLTLLDVADMFGAVRVLNLALLVALIHLSLRLLGRPLRAPRAAVTLLLAAAAVWCEPVWTTLRYGQINLLLAVLVLWDLTRREGHRFAGMGIGIATGIKLTPGLFVVLLALYGAVRGCRNLRGGAARRRPDDGARGLVRPPGPARAHPPVQPVQPPQPARPQPFVRFWNARLRQAAVATATFLGTALFAALVLPQDSRRFWGEAIFQSSRVGRTEITDNQALSGVLARLLHTGEPGALWSVLALLTVVLGLAVAVAAFAAGRRLPHASAWAVTACAVTALLVSPISWSHHWVWCVPLVLLLGAEAQHRASGRWLAGAVTAFALFCSYALWWVPRAPDTERAPELHQNGGQMLLSGLYPAAGAAFLALTGYVAFRALRRPLPYEAPRDGHHPYERQRVNCARKSEA